MSAAARWSTAATTSRRQTVRERLKLYHEQTEPLKEYYEERGILREVDGVGTPDEVFDRIVAAL